MCVVFDNVDQLSQDFQHSVVNLAFQKCKLWKCVGLLTLREETFWRFKNSPPLDAFHRYVYHVSAPRMANVLSRRLDIAKAEQGQQSISIRSESGLLPFTGISLAQFLEIIIDSFLGERQQNIILLEALSANNVRHGLDMFNTFLLSGHTNTDEYIKTYILTGSYTVPFHHVLRSIGLGERRYFDGSKSLIANLFSLEEDGFYSHFQKIRLLNYLNSIRQLDAVPGRGFAAVGSVFAAFQGIIADEEGLRRALDPLLKHRLVEASNGYRVSGEQADQIRITAAGLFYLTTLIYEFSYLDLVSTDTPVRTTGHFESMLKNGTSRGHMLEGIKDRVAKVDTFVAYLEEQEEAEQEYIVRAGLPSAAQVSTTQGIRRTFDEQATRILKSAARFGRDMPRRAPMPSDNN